MVYYAVAEVGVQTASKPLNFWAFESEEVDCPQTALYFL